MCRRWMHHHTRSTRFRSSPDRALTNGFGYPGHAVVRGNRHRHGGRRAIIPQTSWRGFRVDAYGRWACRCGLAHVATAMPGAEVLKACSSATASRTCAACPGRLRSSTVPYVHPLREPLLRVVPSPGHDRLFNRERTDKPPPRYRSSQRSAALSYFGDPRSPQRWTSWRRSWSGRFSSSRAVLSKPQRSALDCSAEADVSVGLRGHAYVFVRAQVCRQS
jgi:hypothetical protein